MIKKERKHTCTSYWKQDGLYDKVRTKEIRVKFLGVTIWHNKESYNCDLIDVESKNIGFKKT
jgi:hypothetical protein